MKAFLILVGALSLCMSNSELACAQWSVQGQNQIRVCFSEVATEIERESPAPGEAFSVYVVLADLTYANVNGFELSYELIVYRGAPGSISRVETIFPPGTIDLGDSSDVTSGSYVVGIQPPLPTASVIPIVEWRFVLSEPDMRIGFKLGPVPNPSNPEIGSPAVVLSDDSILRLNVFEYDPCNVTCIVYPCLDWCPGEPLSALIGPPSAVVALERETFDSVKSLYR